jgi:heme oxygenase
VNSSQVDVDSGIPQGSVLGPSLFIFYINDLQDRLRSTVRLFADDTIAYFTITSEDDAEHLQEDLDKLAQWGKDWHMQFHPAKCTVLTVTNKRNPIVAEYTIRGQLLAAVTSAKYLGVTITDKVNWSQHIDSITNKANRTLGFGLPGGVLHHPQMLS